MQIALEGNLAVSLWHKRAGIATSWSRPIRAQPRQDLDQWEWTTVGEGEAAGPREQSLQSLQIQQVPQLRPRHTVWLSQSVSHQVQTLHLILFLINISFTLTSSGCRLAQIWPRKAECLIPNFRVKFIGGICFTNCSDWDLDWAWAKLVNSSRKI